MEDQDTSFESIVVLSDSLVTENSSSRPSEINCFNDNDTLYQSQITLTRHSPLNDTASSSFMATNAESECQKMEKEILSLKSLLNAYKTENFELRQKLDKRRSDSFTDIESVCFVEKLEKILIETDQIFTDELKAKLSMEYLIKNLWSVIACDFSESKLSNIRQIRDKLLNKIDKSTQHTDNTEQRVHILESDLTHLKDTNDRLKLKLEEQNKLLKELVDLNSKSIIVTPSETTSTTTQMTPPITSTTNTPVNDFYYYNTNGYIAIDKDLSLNEAIKPKEPTPLASSTIYKCPKCSTTVDSESVSHEMYEIHVKNCDGESNLVCMFCLCWFSKEQQQEYLNHIDMHLRNLGNELNNL